MNTANKTCSLTLCLHLFAMFKILYISTVGINKTTGTKASEAESF